MPKKILIVDDEVDIVGVLSMRLQAHGYEVLVAATGIQAVTTAIKEKPDLILLDIAMPILDGYGVIENLKKSAETSKIPIIFVSALPREEVARKAKELGAADYIPKPFESEEVVAKVKKALGE